MRELTVFIGLNKNGTDYIEKIKDELFELFVLVTQDGENDKYYKYSAKDSEFLEYYFKPFTILNENNNPSFIKGPILFIDKIENDDKSIDSFLKENERKYLLEYLEQLQNRSSNFVEETKKNITGAINSYKNIVLNLEEEIKKLEAFLEYSEFCDNKKENLMYDIKKSHFSSLRDKIMLFFKGIRSGKDKKVYQPLLNQKTEKCADEKCTKEENKNCKFTDNNASKELENNENTNQATQNQNEENSSLEQSKEEI